MDSPWTRKMLPGTGSSRSEGETLRPCRDRVYFRSNATDRQRDDRSVFRNCPSRSRRVRERVACILGRVSLSLGVIFIQPVAVEGLEVFDGTGV